MAHLATKRFSYIGQLAILVGFCGAGMIIGGVASFIPLLGKINIFALAGKSSDEIMKALLKPEYVSALRWMQFISTLFLFFLPAVFYAWLCHKKAFTHLGYKHTVDLKEIVIIALIMLACQPLVSILSDITEKLPFAKATLQHFKQVEDSYNSEVEVIAQMKNTGDFIATLFIVALLPALFEETFFRGAVQNLLSRWFKMPVLAIVITAAIFSAVHGSYLGFLSRFVLGFILGWMYYRTGNIWLNIFAHFMNNGMAVVALYFTSKSSAKIDTSQMDEHFPLWMGLLSLIVVYGLFVLFEKVCKKDINEPGKEVLMEGYDHHNPFANNY